MPVVGSAALQIFKTLVNLKKGTEIVINGASGGIGMFATQIAKMNGAIDHEAFVNLCTYHPRTERNHQFIFHQLVFK
jgi:NADPH:quinone reductase-like Zn-dependent oxidoreductase